MKTEAIVRARRTAGDRVMRWALSFALMSVLVGCQTAQTARSVVPPTDRGHVVTYLADRGLDFLDMLGIKLGGNDTLFVRARATKLGMAGLGYFKGRWCGLHGRSVGCWREERVEGGGSFLYLIQYEREPLRGNAFLFADTFSKGNVPDEPEGFAPMNEFAWEIKDGDHHWIDVGVGVGLVAVALEVEVSPRQVLDFVLGILCLDICEDDARARRWTAAQAGAGDRAGVEAATE